MKAELVAHVPAVQDGRDSVGVKFTIPKGWHIYWQNPGDSGIPTTITWTTPKGITTGAIEWPIPEALPYEGLTNYGYSDEVVLATYLQTAHGRPTGTITAKANWLVCKDICIPESATLSAQMPTVTPDAQQHFKKAADAMPRGTDAAIAYYTLRGSNMVLTIDTWMGEGRPRDIRWIPLDDGVIQNNAKQSVKISGGDKGYYTAIITIPKGSIDAPVQYRGLLTYHNSRGRQAVALTAITAEADSGIEEMGAGISLDVSPPLSLLALLSLAFLGGLLLNIMPCVLPILALKALAIAKKADVSRRRAAMLGAAYTGGVVLSFLAIAGIMLALKSSGSAIGWGFQLQQPLFVGALALVMLLVTANLLGLFELPVLFGSRATAADDNTPHGSFLTGALAVLVATPCTAPFMATAIGATLAMPPVQALLIFAALGFGMAAPFLLISLWPAARRLLPKPGAWMKRFKHWLALPMFLTALWLGWVLLQLLNPTPMPASTHHIPYSAETLKKLRDAGEPVLVDATADWCLTCKINERVALNTLEMQAFFREHGIVLMVADWTKSDPQITQYLADFGRNGVPLYVYYPPHQPPVVLPQLLTPSVVRRTISP